MCGICGILNVCGGPVDVEGLKEMNAVLAHRGPDDDGFYVDGPVGLGMRRLSIIDVAGGHQPIPNEDECLWIVYNGEIYNHLEIRKELEAKGHTFRTRTDTETILHLYEEMGAACVTRLNGMFAFAIWDGRNRRLFLARDRLGIKPLYCYRDGEKFLFASEIKAILAAEDLELHLDLEALYHYLTYLYIPAPYTIYREIRKLMPGHCMTAAEGQLEVAQYWDLSYEVDHTLTERVCLDRLDALLADAVKIRLMSEVPLGAFLSGGIDSSTIVHFMTEPSDRRVKTFSIGFPGGEPYSELRYAASAADRIGTDHHELMVTPNAVKLLPEVIRSLDEPMADSSAIPTYLLSKFTREYVTVALSGDGGDELFAGYERYLPIQAALQYERIPSQVRRFILSPLIHLTEEKEQKEGYWARLRRGLGDLDRGAEETFLRWITNFNADLIETLCTEDLREAFRSFSPHALARSYLHENFRGDGYPLNRMLHFETRAYLPDDLLVKVDRMSMAHSLEVRVPLLDHRLVEFAAAMPPTFKLRGWTTKYIFKKLMARYLPREVVYKKKQGFVPPMREWFRDELKEMARDVLLSTDARSRGFFVPTQVERLLDEHQSGAREFHYQIWVLLVLELWCRDYVG